MASSTVEQMIRAKITKLLSTCTYAQQQLFHRVFPSGPSAHQLQQALELLERTRARNKAKESSNGQVD